MLQPAQGAWNDDAITLFSRAICGSYMQHSAQFRGIAECADDSSQLPQVFCRVRPARDTEASKPAVCVTSDTDVILESAAKSHPFVYDRVCALQPVYAPILTSFTGNLHAHTAQVLHSLAHSAHRFFSKKHTTHKFPQVSMPP